MCKESKNFSNFLQGDKIKKNFYGEINLDTNENKLSDSDVFLKKVFNKHVSSSIISMFGAMAAVMANSIIAGKFFGAEGLAVMSIGAPIYSLFSTLGSLAGVGGATLTAHALGSDDTKKANEIFTVSFFLSAGIYFFVAAICFIFLNDLIYFLGASEEIFSAAYEYSEIYILLGFGTTLIYMPANFFKLVGKLKFLSTMFLGMAAANIFLDAVFIKFFYMGISGIAWGTVLSSIGSTIFGMYFLVTGKNSFKFVRPKNFKFVKNLLRLGTPSALNNLMNFFRLLIMNRIISAEAGRIGLAAFSVFTSLEKFSLVILLGIAQATSPFIGVFSKENDLVSVQRIEKRAHILGFAFIIPMMIFIMLFPAEICYFFGIHELHTLKVAENAAFVFALSLPPSVCGYLMVSYYQAAGFTNLTNILVFCRTFLFLVVPAYLLAKFYGINGIWYSLTISALSSLVVMIFAFPYYFKKNYSGFLLQKKYDEKFVRYISFAVKANLEAIIDSVEKIADFCKKSELTRKEIMLVKLSMEEMMISITEHCFEKNSEETMDVRIWTRKTFDDLMIILRIRNGGKLFNPIEYYERLSETDPLALGDALGISMIIKAADSVHYKPTFGINNLTIIIDRQIVKE